MYKLTDFFAVLDKYAPLKLSHELIDRGEYDNSGIIINHHDYVEKVLFSLDLSELVVERAKKLKCDTIVTHHPAIYTPISKLDIDGEQSAIVKAVSLGINVISMHLNLDYAEFGVDSFLCLGLGGKNAKTLDKLSEIEGYGRVAEIENATFRDIKSSAKKTFKTERIICYGNLNEKVNKIASFCGSGGSVAIKYLSETKADLIVTSDAPHHVIKAIIESGKKLMLLTHYASENYGFYKYFEKISEQVCDVQIEYFEDKRFM